MSQAIGVTIVEISVTTRVSERERERERDKTIITGLLNSSLIYTECLNLFFNKLKF